MKTNSFIVKFMASDLFVETIVKKYVECSS